MRRLRGGAACKAGPLPATGTAIQPCAMAPHPQLHQNERETAERLAFRESEATLLSAHGERRCLKRRTPTGPHLSPTRTTCGRLEAVSVSTP